MAVVSAHHGPHDLRFHKGDVKQLAVVFSLPPDRRFGIVMRRIGRKHLVPEVNHGQGVGCLEACESGWERVRALVVFGRASEAVLIPAGQPADGVGAGQGNWLAVEKSHQIASEFFGRLVTLVGSRAIAFSTIASNSQEDLRAFASRVRKHSLRDPFSSSSRSLASKAGYGSKARKGRRQ